MSINVHLLWTRRSLCQYEEFGGRTYLDWGKYTPWRNCWGTMDSMDWLLLSKRVNVVCVLAHVCHPTIIVMKTNVSIFILIFNPIFMQTCIYQVLYLAKAYGWPKTFVFSGKSTRRNKASTKSRTAQGPKAGALNTALEQ